ncbi:hypothetical protein ABPG77_009525 [Micractinium sp. CCAP 211/92]
MSAGLDITAPCPRVNAQLMGEFVGKKVRLVGRVDGVEGSSMRLRTSDDGTVTVNLQGVAPQCQIVEVEGVVNSPNTITEESTCSLTDNFDMSNYNELCKLANSPQYRHMFLP